MGKLVNNSDKIVKTDTYKENLKKESTPKVLNNASKVGTIETNSPVTKTGLSATSLIKNGTLTGLQKNGVTGLNTGTNLSKEEKSENFEKLQSYVSNSNKSNTRDFSISDTIPVKKATYDFTDTAAKKRSESTGFTSFEDKAVKNTTSNIQVSAQNKKKTASESEARNAYYRQYDRLSDTDRNKYGNAETYVEYKLASPEAQQAFDEYVDNRTAAEQKVLEFNSKIAALENEKKKNSKTVSGVNTGFAITASGGTSLDSAKQKNEELDAEIAKLEKNKESYLKYLTNLAYGDGAYEAMVEEQQAEVDKINGWIQGYTDCKKNVSALTAQLALTPVSDLESQTELQRQIVSQQTQLDSYTKRLENAGYTAKDINKLGKIVSSGVKLELGDLAYAISYTAPERAATLNAEISALKTEIGNLEDEIKQLEAKSGIGRKSKTSDSKWTSEDDEAYIEAKAKLAQLKAEYADKTTAATENGIAINEFSQKMTEAGTKELESIVNATTMGDILTQAGVAGVQQITDLAIGALLNPLGVAASIGTGLGTAATSTAVRSGIRQASKSMTVMMIRSYGGGIREGLSNGYTLPQAVAKGITSAATEYAMEKAFGGSFIYDKTGDIIRDASGRLVLENASGWVTKLASSLGASDKLISLMTSLPAEMLSEAIEEIGSDIINPIWDNIISGKKIEYDLKTMIEDGLVGLIMSAVGMSGNLITTAITGSNQSGYTSGQTQAFVNIVQNHKCTQSDARALASSDELIDMLGIDKSLGIKERADEIIRMFKSVDANGVNEIELKLLRKAFIEKAEQKNVEQSAAQPVTQEQTKTVSTDTQTTSQTDIQTQKAAEATTETKTTSNNTSDISVEIRAKQNKRNDLNKQLIRTRNQNKKESIKEQIKTIDDEIKALEKNLVIEQRLTGEEQRKQDAEETAKEIFSDVPTNATEQTATETTESVSEAERIDNFYESLKNQGEDVTPEFCANQIQDWKKIRSDREAALKKADRASNSKNQSKAEAAKKKADELRLDIESIDQTISDFQKLFVRLMNETVSNTANDIQNETKETGYTMPKEFGGFGVSISTEDTGAVTVTLRKGTYDDAFFNRVFPNGLSTTSINEEMAMNQLSSLMKDALFKKPDAFKNNLLHDSETQIPYKDQIDILTRMAEEYGIDLVSDNNPIIDSNGNPTRFNGLVNGGTTSYGFAPYRIQISLDQENPLQEILVHEMTHVLYNSGLLNDFYAAVQQYCENNGIDVEFEKQKIAALYKSVGYQANVDSEFCAYFCGSGLFATKDFVTALTYEKPTVAKKIKEFIDKLSDIVSGKHSDTTVSKEIRELQKMYTEAFAASRQSIATRLLEGRKKRLLAESDTSLIGLANKQAYIAFQKDTKKYQDMLEKEKAIYVSSQYTSRDELTQKADEAAEELTNDATGETPITLAQRMKNTLVLADENRVKSIEVLNEEVKKESNGEEADVKSALNNAINAERIVASTEKAIAANTSAKKRVDWMHMTKDEIESFFDSYDTSDASFGYNEPYAQALRKWNKEYPAIRDNQTLDEAAKANKLNLLIEDIKSNYGWDFSDVPNGGYSKINGIEVATALDTITTDNAKQLSPIARTIKLLSNKYIRYDAIDVAKTMKKAGMSDKDIQLVTGKKKEQGIERNSLRFLREERDLIKQQLDEIDENDWIANSNTENENEFKRKVCLKLAYNVLCSIQDNIYSQNYVPGSPINFEAEFRKQLLMMIAGANSYARNTISTFEKFNKEADETSLSEDFKSEINSILTVNEKEQILEAVQMYGDSALISSAEDLFADIYESSTKEYTDSDIEPDNKLDKSSQDIYDTLAGTYQQYNDEEDYPEMRTRNSKGEMGRPVEDLVIEGGKIAPIVSEQDDITATFTEGFGQVNDDSMTGVESIMAEKDAWSDYYHNTSRYHQAYENSKRVLLTLVGMYRDIRPITITSNENIIEDSNYNSNDNISEIGYFTFYINPNTGSVEKRYVSLPSIYVNTKNDNKIRSNTSVVWSEDTFVTDFLDNLAQSVHGNYTTLYSHEAVYPDGINAEDYSRGFAKHLVDEIVSASETSELTESIGELYNFPLVESKKYYLETRLKAVEGSLKEIESLSETEGRAKYKEKWNALTNRTAADKKYNSLENTRATLTREFDSLMESKRQLDSSIVDIVGKDVPVTDAVEEIRSNLNENKNIYGIPTEQLSDMLYDYDAVNLSVASYRKSILGITQKMKRVFNGEWVNVDAENRLLSYDEGYTYGKGHDGFYEDSVYDIPIPYYHDLFRCDILRLTEAENRYQKLKEDGIEDKDNPYLEDHQIYTTGLDAIIVTAFSKDSQNFAMNAIQSSDGYRTDDKQSFRSTDKDGRIKKVRNVNGSTIEADNYWDELTGAQVNFAQLPLNRKSRIIQDNVPLSELSNYASGRYSDYGEFELDSIITLDDIEQVKNYLRERAKSITILTESGKETLYDMLGNESAALRKYSYTDERTHFQHVASGIEQLFNPIDALVGETNAENTRKENVLKELASEDGVPLTQILLTQAVYDKMPELKGWKVKTRSISSEALYDIDPKNLVVTLNQYSSPEEMIKSLIEFSNLAYIRKQGNLSWDDLKYRSAEDELRRIQNTAAKSERGDSDSAQVFRTWLLKYRDKLNEKYNANIPDTLDFNPVELWYKLSDNSKTAIKKLNIFTESYTTVGALRNIEKQHVIANTDQRATALKNAMESIKHGGIQGYNYVETIRYAVPEVKQKFIQDKIASILDNKIVSGFTNKVSSLVFAATPKTWPSVKNEINSLFDSYFSYQENLKWKSENAFDLAKDARTKEIEELKSLAEETSLDEVEIAPKEIDKYATYQDYLQSVEESKNQYDYVKLFGKENDTDRNYSRYRIGTFLKMLMDQYNLYVPSKKLTYADIIKESLGLKTYSEAGKENAIQNDERIARYSYGTSEVTESVYNAMQQKLNNLRVMSGQTSKNIGVAAAQGDRSENAEYSAAKEDKSKIEQSIRELESKLNGLKVADNVSNNTILQGSKIIIELDDGTQETFYLADSSIVNSELGFALDPTLDFGKELIGKQLGDDITYKVLDETDKNDKKKRVSHTGRIILVDNNHNDFDTTSTFSGEKELGGKKPKIVFESEPRQKQDLFDMSLINQSASDYLRSIGLDLNIELSNVYQPGWMFDDRKAYVVKLNAIDPLRRLAIMSGYANAEFNTRYDLLTDESSSLESRYDYLRDIWFKKAASGLVSNSNPIDTFKEQFRNAIEDVDSNNSALMESFEEYINQNGREDLRYLVSDKQKEIAARKKDADRNQKFDYAVLNNILAGTSTNAREISNAETSLNRSTAQKINADTLFPFESIESYIESLNEEQLKELWSSDVGLCIMLSYQSLKKSRNDVQEMAEIMSRINSIYNSDNTAFEDDTAVYEVFKQYSKEKMRQEIENALANLTPEYNAYRDVLNAAVYDPVTFFSGSVMNNEVYQECIDTLGINTAPYYQYLKYDFMANRVHIDSMSCSNTASSICSDLSKLDSLKSTIVYEQTDGNKIVGTISLGDLFEAQSHCETNEIQNFINQIFYGADEALTKKIAKLYQSHEQVRNMINHLLESLQDDFVQTEDGLWDTNPNIDRPNQFKWNGAIQRAVEQTGMSYVYPLGYKQNTSSNQFYNLLNFNSFMAKEKAFESISDYDLMMRADEADKLLTDTDKSVLDKPEFQTTLTRTEKSEIGKQIEDDNNPNEGLYAGTVRDGYEQTIMAIYNEFVKRENYREALRCLWILEKHSADNRYLKVVCGRIVNNMSSDFKVENLKQQISRTIASIARAQGEPDFNIVVPDSLYDNYKQALDSNDVKQIELASNEIERYIADYLPPSDATDLMRTIRTQSMLFSVKTHLGNIASTLCYTGYNILKDALASGIQNKIMGSDAEKAYIQLIARNAEDAAMVKSCSDDFDKNPEIREIVLRNGKFNDSGIDLKYHKAKGKTIVGKAIVKAGSFASELLEKEDVVFARTRYAMSLAQRLKATGAKSLSDLDQTKLDEIRTLAIEDSLKSIFRDKNKVSDAAASIPAYLWNKAKESDSTVGRIGWYTAYAAEQSVIPFVRTPANVVVSGTDLLLPLSLAQAISNYNKAKNTFDTEEQKQCKIKYADALARTALNTALTGVGALLASTGLLSGGKDDDEKDDSFLKSLGVNDYSVTIPTKFGALNVSLTKFGSVMVPIMMAADVVDLCKNDFDKPELSSIMSRTLKTFSELTGLDSFTSVVTDLQYYIGDDDWMSQLAASVLTSYIGQYCPTMFSALMKSGDKTTMKNRIDVTRSAVNNVKRSTCEEWNALNNGNVKYENRPWVTGNEMIDAGWDSESDIQNLSGADGINTYSKGITNGNTMYEFTPIKENGTILSPSKLEEYAQKCFASGDPITYDAEHDKLICMYMNDWTQEAYDKYHNELQPIKDKSVKERDQAGTIFENDYSIKSLESKILGSYSDQRVAKIDVWGETDSRNVFSNIFHNAINPFTITPVSSLSKEEVNDKLLNLNKQLKSANSSKNVFPTTVSSNARVDDVKLSNSEYETYAIAVGQKRFELIQTYLTSEKYQKDSIYRRADVISDLYSQAYKYGQEVIREQRKSSSDLSYKEEVINNLSNEDKVSYFDSLYIFDKAKNSGTSDKGYQEIDTIVEDSIDGTMSQDVINLLAGVSENKTTGQKGIDKSSDLDDLQLLAAGNIGSKEYYEHWKPILKSIDNRDGIYSDIKSSDKAQVWQEEVTKIYPTYSPEYTALMNYASEYLWISIKQIDDAEDGKDRTRRETYYNVLQDEDAATAFANSIEDGSAKRYIIVDEIRNTPDVTSEQKIQMFKSLYSGNKNPEEKYKKIDDLFDSNVFDDWTTDEIFDAISLYYECGSSKSEFKKKFQTDSILERDAVASLLHKTFK